MKKNVVMLLLVLSITMVVAETACDLDVTLLNQDPYPAVPGDYAKLVFQIEGIDSPYCDDITFNLLSGYPIEFDPGESGLRTFKKVDYLKDYESNLLIPYKVRINKDALNGANPIEARIQNKNDAPILKTFDIEIDDVRADFEVRVQNYDYQTHELILEILNIESSDVEALSVEVPKQDGIEIKGANQVIVGDLDSNEYTSADFEAIPTDGEFKIILIYSDTINTRRSIEKTLTFDSSYFTNRVADQTTTSTTTYLILGLIILSTIYFSYKKITKKK